MLKYGLGFRLEESEDEHPLAASSSSNLYVEDVDRLVPAARTSERSSQDQSKKRKRNDGLSDGRNVRNSSENASSSSTPLQQ